MLTYGHAGGAGNGSRDWERLTSTTPFVRKVANDQNLYLRLAQKNEVA